MFVWERESLCAKGGPFLLFCIRSRCQNELDQQSAEVWLDWRTIFVQDCPRVPVAKVTGCCCLSSCTFHLLLCSIHSPIFLLYPCTGLNYAYSNKYNYTVLVPAYQPYRSPLASCAAGRFAYCYPYQQDAPGRRLSRLSQGWCIYCE